MNNVFFCESQCIVQNWIDSLLWYFCDMYYLSIVLLNLINFDGRSKSSVIIFSFTKVLWQHSWDEVEYYHSFFGNLSVKKNYYICHSYDHKLCRF